MPPLSEHRERVRQLAGDLGDAIAASHAEGLDEKTVKQVRTTVRRLEAALAHIDVRVPKKLAKRLKSLRRTAGAARDTDVLLELAETIEDPSNHVSQLTEFLHDKRNAHEEQLITRLEKLKDRGVDAQLDDLGDDVSTSSEDLDARRESGDTTAEIRTRYLEMAKRVPVETEPLHEFRKTLKSLRYRLEYMPGAEAERMLAEVKEVTDAIGTWHDWMVLAQVAEAQLGDAAISLNSKLRTRAATARLTARDSAIALRERWKREAQTEATGKKPPARASVSSRRVSKRAR